MPDGWESSEWFNHHHTLCMVSKGGYSKFYLDGCKSEGCIYAIMGPLDTKSEIGAISSVYNSQNSKSSHSAMPIKIYFGIELTQYWARHYVIFGFRNKHANYLSKFHIARFFSCSHFLTLWEDFLFILFEIEKVLKFCFSGRKMLMKIIFPKVLIL